MSRIITKTRLKDFYTEHSDAKTPLLVWYKKMKEADCANFGELKILFPGVDYVKNDLYVFNIKGNKYRLIVRILFRAKTVYIRFVGTHEEYDNVDIKKL